MIQWPALHGLTQQLRRPSRRRMSADDARPGHLRHGRRARRHGARRHAEFREARAPWSPGRWSPRALAAPGSPRPSDVRQAVLRRTRNRTTVLVSDPGRSFRARLGGCPERTNAHPPPCARLASICHQQQPVQQLMGDMHQPLSDSEQPLDAGRRSGARLFSARHPIRLQAGRRSPSRTPTSGQRILGHPGRDLGPSPAGRCYIDSGAEIPSSASVFASVRRTAETSARRAADVEGSPGSTTRRSR